MQEFRVSLEHALDENDARGRIQGFLSQLKSQYQEQITDIKESWTDDVIRFAFRLYGLPVEGNLYVASQEVCLEGKIPLLALPFKSKIEEVIVDNARRLLAARS